MDRDFADSEIQNVSSAELLDEPSASHRQRSCPVRALSPAAFAFVAVCAGACVARSLHKSSQQRSPKVLSPQSSKESAPVIDTNVTTGGFTKEGVGCKNWNDAAMGRFFGTTQGICRETCQTTRGCHGYNYQAEPSEDADHAGVCILFQDECEQRENAGWVYERMGAPLPQWSGLRYMTCDTRSADQAWTLHGVGGRRIGNTCVGVQWHGFRTKVEEYLKLATRLAEEGSQELLVVCDGSDMFFGGCSDEEVYQRYNKVSLAAGAPVIAGAENFQYPQAVFPYETMDSRRKDVMNSFNMGPGNYDMDGHQYRHANSGWMIGPPTKLKEVLECMLEMGKGNFTGTPNKGDPTYDDQHGLHACMFAHPDLIALDYSGLLVTNMAGFPTYGDNTVLRRADGVVKNAAGPKWSTQCFIHLNGGSWGWVKVLSL